MEIFDESNEDLVTETVYADVNCTNCDTPGARKISGLAGHSSDLHCCAWCYCTLLEVNQRSGYIAESKVFLLFIYSDLLRYQRLCYATGL